MYTDVHPLEILYYKRLVPFKWQYTTNMNQMLPKIGSKSSWFKALFVAHGLEILLNKKNKYPLVI